MFLITPKWKKEAKDIYKAGQKFLHYKRDLLKEDRIDEIKSRLVDLKAVMKGRGPEAKEATQEAVRQLDNTCESALPRQKKKDAFGENIESLFVALVIAIGIRSYYAQPFIIPTGSMQPSLNGVICESVDKEDWPNIVSRTGQMALRGRAYVHKVAKEDLVFRADMNGVLTQNPGKYKLAQTFHRVTKLRFENKTIMAHGIPASAFALPIPHRGFEGGEYNLAKHAVLRNGYYTIPKGTVLYSGYVDSGDVIIANKMAYHFRKPKRGEPFIFDTRGINTNGGSSSTADQQNATHYIKRCVGVPGDTLSISSGSLLVDGKEAQEKYIQRVIQAEGEYAKNQGYQAEGLLSGPSSELILTDSKRKRWMAEYAAMGDNTKNSLDSRYWGSVKEYNLVAPATFTLWPITTGHWGFIK